MIMADILKIFLLIVGLLTVYVSYWLIAQANYEALHIRKNDYVLMQVCDACPAKDTDVGRLRAVKRGGAPELAVVNKGDLREPKAVVCGHAVMVERELE